MPDRLLQLGSSLLQHGPDSDRVYVMRIVPDDTHQVLDEAKTLAERHGYGKIVVKARAQDHGELARRGYSVEAVVPCFHAGGEAALFAGRFLDGSRATDPQQPRIREVLEAAEAARSEQRTAPELPELVVREAGPEDTEALAALYSDVFASYPFPIDDPDHLRAEHERGTRYFAAYEESNGGGLVAASSMEPGGAPGAVEMTDFATLPAHRRRGIASHLLTLMDRGARAAGVRVAYTIARACSFGMNITFGRCGYEYAGTLVNNTGIAGAIESMNVWYKILEDPI